MLKIKRKLEIPKLLECHSEIVHDEKRFLQAAVRSVFLGADLVNWLIKTYNPTDGDFKAIEKLIDEELYDPTLPHQLIYPVDMGLLGPGRRYYRFIEDQFIEYKKDPAIINLHGLDTSSLQFFYEQEQPESVFKAMDEFTEVLKEIYTEFGHDNGARIAYDELADSDLFNSKYLPLVSKLAYLDLSPLIANEKYIKAFFINVYNGFAIHMVLARYGTKKKLEMSKIERFDALNHYKYNIGGHNYTLNDIQHGILRGNDSTGSSMPAAAMQFVFKVKTDSTPRFKERDPRFKYILRTPDPKIHFALNYGTTSCPPLRCYSATEIDDQLDKAAKEFCTEDCEVKEVKGKKVICINQIFNWYCVDFGKTKNDVLEFLLKCVQDESKRLEIIQMLEEVNNFNVEFKKSDMKTNVYKAAE